MRDPETGLPARRAALRALAEVDDGAWSNVAVPRAVDGLAAERDRAFASHLAYDTLRWQGTLDWALEQVVARPLDQVEPGLLRVLRLGALQLLRSGVPARAAVSTSVALARESVPAARARGAGGFVNGVLRGLARRLDDLPWPGDHDTVAHLVLATAHPAWIVEDLVDHLGEQRARTVLDADNDPPGVTLRATGDRGALVAELRALGIDAAPGELAPEAVRAPGADPRRLAAVREGRARPQDEASMVVVHALAPAPGERVLEVGAGPGGKSTHLAALVGPDGHVTAVEPHPHRARLVREAAGQLGVPVDVVEADATDPGALTPAGEVDAVLVDAPCSDLGTGRRRPEVRWRRTPEDVASLSQLQDRLLDAAAGVLRPGGRLVYSVCTWTRAETTDHLRVLLAAHPELELVAERQLLPDRDDTDGMFVATFRRSSWSPSRRAGRLP